MMSPNFSNGIDYLMATRILKWKPVVNGKTIEKYITNEGKEIFELPNFSTNLSEVFKLIVDLAGQGVYVKCEFFDKVMIVFVKGDIDHNMTIVDGSQLPFTDEQIASWICITILRAFKEFD